MGSKVYKFGNHCSDPFSLSFNIIPCASVMRSSWRNYQHSYYEFMVLSMPLKEPHNGNYIFFLIEACIFTDQLEIFALYHIYKRLLNSKVS